MLTNLAPSLPASAAAWRRAGPEPPRGPRLRAALRPAPDIPPGGALRRPRVRRPRARLDGRPGPERDPPRQLWHRQHRRCYRKGKVLRRRGGRSTL